MHHLKEFLERLQLDFIQSAAVLLGVAEVLLARINNIWLYPVGISGILLSIYTLFKVQLYAECILHLYYLVMSIYGWWYWGTTHHHQAVQVTNAKRIDWLITLGIVFGGWFFLYLFLMYLTPSQVPVWDAWVSSTGCAGMWLLARRKTENWILLNVSNAFAIPLYLYKGLVLFALLTIFLFIVACKGYFDWRKMASNKVSLT